MAIRRLDFKGTHGWQVEIGRLHHTKYFGDKTYNCAVSLGFNSGRRAALLQALLYEARILKSLPPIKHHQPPRPLDKPLSNNRTTRLCGISETSIVDYRRLDKPRYHRFSVHIGPERNMTLGFNQENRKIRLKEAIMIRRAAIQAWPDFTVQDGRKLLAED